MNKREREFVAVVLDFYKVYGRHTLPWRLTHDPYRILVSELMLQQTQVERVVPKYEAFVERWPTAEQLANAPLSEVLKAWQGLGYNRRAKYLHECAKVVTSEYDGKFPNDEKTLLTLPGVGPYTASAIVAFAYNQPVVLIETNVRRVYIHHFFPDAEAVTDIEILELVKKILPSENLREWYAALMDYGTYLKKEFGNANQRSKHYSKQSKFAGSDRQIRGAIIRELSKSDSTERVLLNRLNEFDGGRIKEQLKALEAEGMIRSDGKQLHLG